MPTTFFFFIVLASVRRLILASSLLIAACSVLVSAPFEQTTWPVVWKADGSYMLLEGIGDASGMAINELGQVLGSYAGGAFIWTNGSYQTLNAPKFASGAAINDAGHVVGLMAGVTPSFSDAVLWRNGSPEIIFSGGREAIAWDINNSDQVIIMDRDIVTQRAPLPFLWDNGQISPVACFPGDDHCIARDINNLGVIAGSSFSTSTGVSHAFLNDGGKITELGPFPGFSSFVPVDINDRGQVVGTMILDRTEFHGFLWQGGTFIDLGLGFIPHAIANSSGSSTTLVGNLVTSGSLLAAPYIWKDGVRTPLAFPSVRTESAFPLGINSSGEIAGTIVLTPVPEPVTGLSALIGFGLLLYRKLAT